MQDLENLKLQGDNIEEFHQRWDRIRPEVYPPPNDDELGKAYCWRMKYSKTMGNMVDNYMDNRRDGGQSLSYVAIRRRVEEKLDEQRVERNQRLLRQSNNRGQTPFTAGGFEYSDSVMAPMVNQQEQKAPASTKANSQQSQRASSQNQQQVIPPQSAYQYTTATFPTQPLHQMVFTQAG